MNEHDFSSDPELLEALREDKAPEAPRAAKARVFGRMSRTIAAISVAHVDSAGEPLPRTTTGPPAKSYPALMSRPFWLVAAAFSIGAATGAAVGARLWREPIERVIYVDRIVTVPSPPPTVSAPLAGIVDPSREPDLPAAAPSSATSSAQPGGSGVHGLAAERALLDGARKALGADDYPAALRGVQLHATRFPAGVLVEEREALAIKTLAASGHPAEARARAAAFGQRFPHSLFGPSVAEALETNP
jgi:hypothetical protein